MSTIVEDPGIPLVNRNGGFQMYTQDSMDATASITKPERKYGNVGYRLAVRKELFQRRKIVADFALLFGLCGIVLMILETELMMAGVYGNLGKSHPGSVLLKLCITITTCILLGFIVWYHALDVKLYMVDNTLEDWRLAMHRKRVIKIVIELLINAVHPIPGNYDFNWTTLDTSAVDAITGKPILKPTTVKVPLDVIFSIPMFLRFYLLARVLMLHSKLFTDASSQSLGALNRIHFNFKFIFKSMMSMYPEYVLFVLMMSGLVVASWALRACEMYHDEVHANFFNSMWLIAITFLSVGYGDIVPISYCGRSIAVLTGIFGAGCTALVVAVLARKLELSRAEKYVHNFVIDVELDKRLKHMAANILKAGWFLYKCKKEGRVANVRKYQRKLLKAIHGIRNIKQEQRRLLDNAVTLVEMAKTQSNIYQVVENIEESNASMNNRVETLENKLTKIEDKLETISDLLMGKRRDKP